MSPSSHSAFDSPIGLLQFIEQLRTLSGGKPTGFKLAIGHPWEFFGIVKAMLATGITPDFIVIDGGEGGTGAAFTAVDNDEVRRNAGRKHGLDDTEKFPRMANRQFESCRFAAGEGA